MLARIVGKLAGPDLDEVEQIAAKVGTATRLLARLISNAAERHTRFLFLFNVLTMNDVSVNEHRIVRALFVLCAPNVKKMADVRCAQRVARCSRATVWRTACAAACAISV
ncbi:hypothetical protein [Paraburkholderia antibiotica]|uniref:Uncharacterized protein n=1 Tax=Paraburkholderia antibiotica TaxID=2728839 RepID=A0A7Y0FGN0_9BURK|nr:hypothetical protein [Paraburkholderia antibiotica]NML35238.1 hypothetical protein [Paraburkholderia antibiotica]